MNSYNDGRIETDSQGHSRSSGPGAALAGLAAAILNLVKDLLEVSESGGRHVFLHHPVKLTLLHQLPVK
jgi:hypothetical protein